MLSRFYEWYRVVNSNPSSDTIDRRKVSVSSLVADLVKEDNRDSLIEYTAAVVGGLAQGFTAMSPLVQRVVKAIRDQDSAFPEDLAENAVEVRTCCALVLGEILSRSLNESDSGEAVTVATFLQSGLSTRTLPPERYQKRMLEELLNLANEVLAHTASIRRQRVSFTAGVFDIDPESTEVPEILENLKETFEKLQGQAEVDREEINVLWWMFARHSSTASKPLAELDPATAALCVGSELAKLVLLPPAMSTREMVRRAVAEGRKAATISVKPLAEFVRTWKDPIVSRLTLDGEAMTSIVGKYPCLLPLSWLCRRLHDSAYSTVWDAEFEKLTGIPSTFSLSPLDLASQVFYECIAQREYMSE